MPAPYPARARSIMNIRRGRFAPSPSGPLHFGSLVAAVASYLDARRGGGHWLVRIEDLDAPRVIPGAADDILRTLDTFGFRWDGSILYQSSRAQAYDEAIERLRAIGAGYPCACSRREVGELGGVYPGTCRNGLWAGRNARAWRVAVGAEELSFVDCVQGVYRQNLADEIGDFIVRRADGCIAYQLAVVVDDAWQAITDVVRGADLLDSTPRQIWLQSLLKFPTPTYAHVPIALDVVGNKLSKQTLARPIQREHPTPALHAALRFLGQEIPSAFAKSSVASIWEWAETHWDMARVPSVYGQPFGD